MQAQELERRQERAERETWVIAETENGYRIHSPTSGGRPYLVTGIPDAPRCTCPDFEHHENDPEWRCKHVLAISARYGPDGNGVAASERVVPIALGVNPVAPSGADTVMLLKRSVSPDGRIDSLSVEFSCPVQENSGQEVTRQAELLLELQAEIVEGFLGKSGRTVSPTPRPKHRTSEGDDEPAELLRVGGADGNWGRRLYITISTGERALRLYGSKKQLGEHLERAGYIAHAGNLREGVQLNLPCRIVTEPSDDGRFLNVTQVLPPHPGR